MTSIETWPDWLAVLTVCPLAYGALIAVLRIGGKRTLSKLNAFDFTVTIALGSLLATVVVSPSVSIGSGVAAIVALVGLQAALTFVSVRWSLARRIVTSPPCAVVVDGQVLDEALRRHRLTRSELRQGLRSQGIATIDDIDLVVLETDGSFSVLRGPHALDGWAAEDVER